MKRLNIGEGRQFLTVRLVLCIIMVLGAVGGTPASSRACGAIAHAHIAEHARDWYEASYPDLAAFLRQHPDALKSGTHFPDWCMATNDPYWDDIAEDAHDTSNFRVREGEILPGSGKTPEFREAYIKYIQSTITPPYDDYDYTAIAFLFGLISHQEADFYWHDNHTNYFLSTAQQHDTLGWPCAADHTRVELGFDSFVFWRDGIPTINWVWPTDAILAAYRGKGEYGLWMDIDVMLALEPAKASAQMSAAVAGAGYFAACLPWTAANYWSYQPGGENDLIIRTADAWQKTWYPSLTISTPSQDITTRNPDVTITGTVTSLTMPTVTISVDGDEPETLEVTDGQFEKAITLTEQRAYAITVTAVDGFEHTVTATRNVTYAPKPVCGSSALGISGRTVSFTDASIADSVLGPAVVMVNWGDTYLTKYSLLSPISHTYIYNGKYMIRQSVQDATGWITYCDPVTVTVPQRYTVTVNMSKPATYATVKILLNGVIKAQGSTAAAGLTWTSGSLEANAGYKLSVTKAGKTFSCNGATVDLSTGNQTVACTVAP